MSNSNPSHIICLDANRRDTSVFPDPNRFGITLERPLSNVTRIEVTEIIVPDPRSVVPPLPNQIVYIRLSTARHGTIHSKLHGDEIMSQIFLDLSHAPRETLRTTVNNEGAILDHRLDIVADLFVELFYYDGSAFVPWPSGTIAVKLKVKGKADRRDAMEREAGRLKDAVDVPPPEGETREPKPDIRKTKYFGFLRPHLRSDLDKEFAEGLRPYEYMGSKSAKPAPILLPAALLAVCTYGLVTSV